MGEMNEVYCLRSPSLANHVLSCIPASPVQLTFSIADNPPEICSLVVFVSLRIFMKGDHSITSIEIG
ncbi:hypothetical protein C9189_26270 [Escherichia coli]|uniref:hypothetical protein n=1 Tax=Escherichia coli TaxID=562 RepID=UPI0010AD655F|nr:hypothetical protein [Escherichia coli]TJE83614.1 hypothetical protein C9211_26245 [Escherichia coli]TJF76192.1 hypothetical protein C9189_26270 [Escherichia coli]